MLYLTTAHSNISSQHPCHLFVTHTRGSLVVWSTCGLKNRKMSRLESDAAFGALSSGHKFVEISDRFMPVISLPAGRYCGEYLHPRTLNNLYTDFIFRCVRMLTRLGLTRGRSVAFVFLFKAFRTG